jgi:hypothetical protein
MKPPALTETPLLKLGPGGDFVRNVLPRDLLTQAQIEALEAPVPPRSSTKRRAAKPHRHGRAVMRCKASQLAALLRQCLSEEEEVGEEALR